MLREHLEQWRAEDVLKAANARYRRQEEALAALMRSSVAGPEQAESVLREVTEVVAATLGRRPRQHLAAQRGTDGAYLPAAVCRDGVAPTALPKSPPIVIRRTFRR